MVTAPRCVNEFCACMAIPPLRVLIHSTLVDASNNMLPNLRTYIIWNGPLSAKNKQAFIPEVVGSNPAGRANSFKWLRAMRTTAYLLGTFLCPRLCSVDVRLRPVQ